MCLSSRNGDRMSPATHPHILLCSRWALRILMWTIEGQCKHCGNVCGPTRKYYCWQGDVFSTANIVWSPWLVFWLPERPISLAARRNTNNSPAQDVSGWQRVEDATLIMPLLGCQPTNDIIDIPTSGLGWDDAHLILVLSRNHNSVKSQPMFM